MERAYNEKLTRAIGVSNFCVSCFQCIDKVLTVRPALNQVQYHVGEGADPEGLRTYCKDNGIVLQAYSPLGNNATELIHGKELSAIAAAHNKSTVQIALKWIWQNGVPLATKSTKPEHLSEDIDIFSWKLSTQEMATLNAATKPSGTPSFMCKK